MLLVSPRVEAPRVEPPHLTGSIKRKVEDDRSPASSAMPDVVFPSDSKRLCLDDVTLSMGPGANPAPCPDMQHSPFSASHGASSMAGHGMLLENTHMNGSGIGSPFSVPPNAEVGQKGPLAGHYNEKGSSLPAVDQELQDLLEELTKMPDPSPNELDLEKILGSKTEEPLGSLPHPPSALNSTPKSSPQATPLDNHLPSKDFSPGCNPTSGGSPQMRPSSTGASYPVPSQNKAAVSPIASGPPSKSQAQPTHLSGPNWHAQQLKHLAASKQAPSPKHQTPSWPAISSQGLSPPYRQGSSPHHQPFSPQNVMVSNMSSNGLPGSSIQSPQNSLLSSITSNSNPPGGLSPPFGPEKLSSPVLNQQSFSPPNSMLPSISASSLPGNNLKSSPNHLASAGAGPSPYRPEKLSSPALHQQPFSPQSTLIPNSTPAGNPTSMQSSLYKSMSTTQSKNMNVILPQGSSGLHPGLVGEGPLAQDQFSFGNTKPLSHFSSDPTPSQKMSPMASSSGQQSLMHYLRQQAGGSPQSQPASNSQFLQQQLRQLMQPSRMQVQPPPLSSQARQDQASGIAARLQEPGVPPNSGSVPAPTPALVNDYTMRNQLLKQQIMRRQQQQQQQQQLQEKQRHSLMGMSSEQRGPFVGQQMNQFPAVSQSMPTDCSQSLQPPGPNHHMMPPAQGILQNTLASGVVTATMNPGSGAMVMIPQNPSKQPGIFSPNSDFNHPLRPSQNSLGMNSGCQTAHSHPAARPGMALSGFAAGPLVAHNSAQQPLRQQAMTRLPGIYSAPSAQMWTQAAVPRIPNQGQMEASLQQFSNNPLFSKQNVRPSIPGQAFSHQAGPPPNQIVPGIQGRPIPKVNLGQSNQSLIPLNNQNLKHSLNRGPLPVAMNVMKSMPQGVSGFNQLNPVPAAGPPSYPGSAGQSPATYNRINVASELPPHYDFIAQQNMLPAACSEADFIDSLMKSSEGTEEDWLNNLTLIDDILGQHIQSTGHV